MSNQPDDLSTQQKIVYVTSSFEPDVGGTVRQTANQARALRARGYPVVVLTSSADRTLPRREDRDGLRVVRLRRGAGRGSELFVMLGWTRWLLRHRRKVGVVQAVLHPEFLLCACLAGLGRRASMLWAGRGDADRTLGAGGGHAARLVQAARRAGVRMGHNIVLTPFMARELERYRPGSAAVIPVPVDSGHFRPPTQAERQSARQRLGVGEGEALLLYTGHLDPGKGVHRLIEALGMLGEGAVKLCVVGGDRGRESSYGADLRRSAAGLGLGDRVHFAGYVSDVRDPFLWAADLFVLPSEREGMPNSVLEAMACGLPSIFPESAGGSDLLTPALGAIPPDNSPEHLAEALREMLDRREEWAQMGEAARRVAQGYSLAEVTDRYEKAYRELARRP